MHQHFLFVGIDVSKFKHDVAVMNDEKQLLGKPFVVADNLPGFQDLLHRLEEYSEKYQTQRVYIGLESTSDYWKNLYYWLKKQSAAFSITVINPVRTKAFGKTELRRAKTDPINAKDIAQFMVEKRPAASLDRPPVFENIKDIDKRIYQIKKQQTMLINKLRLELTKVAPEIEKDFVRLRGRQIMAVLEKYPTAADIAGAEPAQLAAITYGKKSWSLSAPFLARITALAHRSVGYKTGAGAGYVVQSLIRSLSHVQQEVELLKKQLAQLYHTIHEQDSLLVTIPGIGIETAIALEAYIGDVSRFSRPEKLVAYFGMNPTVDRTGKSVRNSFLQKKGEPIVRHKLFMAVLSMLSMRQEPFYSYYCNLVAAGKPKLVALCAAMRKLLVIIFVMLKNQKPFNTDFQ
jgi:transposase